MNMYFIALVAPDEINKQVLKWKLMMKEKYKCEVALKSPAHITLIPPFWMKPELESMLIDSINEFSSEFNPITILLRNFSFFKPRVIYVAVEENEPLSELKQKLEQYLVVSESFPVKTEERPFHPHVTIATRDLYKKAFYESWEYFNEKKYEAEWKSAGISVLRHNQKNWDVIATSQFNKL